MSDTLASRSPSRRKASAAHATGYTSLPPPSRPADVDYNIERDLLPSKKSSRRRERNKDSSNGKTKVERGVSQSDLRGSSSELMAFKGDNATRSAAEYEKKLNMLQQDFNGLRALITCKICDRPLYEPFVISCGHTFCYSCLCTWFVNNKKNKTCPDCRVPVIYAPAPSYLIREMTQIFVSRQGNLPLEDTLEQHTKWRMEEAQAVHQDKNNAHPTTGGLFKGCFPAIEARHPLRRIQDNFDGVERCPVCTWEIEDDECYHCGARFGNFSGADYSSEIDGDLGLVDADLENEIDDYEGDEMDPLQGYSSASTSRDYTGQQRRRSRRIRPTSETAQWGGRDPRIRILTHGHVRSRDLDIFDDDDMDEEEGEEDGDSSMRDFIDDDSPSDLTSSSTLPSLRPLSSAPESPSASVSMPDEDRATGHFSPLRNPGYISASGNSSTTSSDTDEDAELDRGPIPHGRRRRQDQPRNRMRRYRQRRVSTSSGDEQSPEVADGGEDEEETPAPVSRSRRAPRQNRRRNRDTEHRHENSSRRSRQLSGH